MIRLVSGPQAPDDASPQVPDPWPTHHPHGKRHWQGWHGWSYLFILAGLPAIVLVLATALTALGRYMVDVTTAPTPAHSPAATHHPAARPTHTAPVYDLAGYQAAISGARQRAYGAALHALNVDMAQADFVSAVTDAGNLKMAAGRWLYTLKRTNPPPVDRAAKAGYMVAVALGQQAAATMLTGLQETNLGTIQQGADQTVKAVAALARAAHG